MKSIRESWGEMMPTDLEKMAAEINHRLDGLDCYRMSFWGGLAFQPTENIFKYLATRAEEDSLVLQFRDDGGDEKDLQLWKPLGLTITAEDELVVRAVDRLRWGNSNPRSAPSSRSMNDAVSLGLGRWPK